MRSVLVYYEHTLPLFADYKGFAYLEAFRLRKGVAGNAHIIGCGYRDYAVVGEEFFGWGLRVGGWGLGGLGILEVRCYVCRGVLS